MKTLLLADAQTRFPSVLRDVGAGNEVAIAYDKGSRAVAVIVPYEKWTNPPRRRLGTLEGKMSVVFANDFTVTDEELVNL